MLLCWYPNSFQPWLRGQSDCHFGGDSGPTEFRSPPPTVTTISCVREMCKELCIRQIILYLLPIVMPLPNILWFKTERHLSKRDNVSAKNKPMQLALTIITLTITVIC